MATDRTDKKRLARLEERVAYLEKNQVELEEHLLRFVVIVHRFMTNPKVKASLGGQWSSDPAIQALLESTQEQQRESDVE
jgi:hypothetical protein